MLKIIKFKPLVIFVLIIIIFTINSCSSENTNNSKPQVEFAFIPIKIEAEPSDPGYKNLRVHFILENMGSEWAYFNGSASVLLKPLIFTNEDFSYEGYFCENIKGYLIPPGVRISGSTDLCSGPTESKNTAQFDFRNVGETLKPISVDFSYKYSKLSTSGSNTSDFVFMDPITIDLSDINPNIETPFSQPIAIGNLPFTIEMSEGTLLIKSARVVDGEIELDTSFTNPSSGESVSANLFAHLINDKGIIGHLIVKGQRGGKASVSYNNIGPKQTKEVVLQSSFPGDKELITESNSLYLLIGGLGISIGNEGLGTKVEQVIQIFP